MIGQIYKVLETLEPKNRGILKKKFILINPIQLSSCEQQTEVLISTQTKESENQ